MSVDKYEFLKDVVDRMDHLKYILLYEAYKGKEKYINKFTSIHKDYIETFPILSKEYDTYDYKVCLNDVAFLALCCDYIKNNSIDDFLRSDMLDIIEDYESYNVRLFHKNDLYDYETTTALRDIVLYLAKYSKDGLCSKSFNIRVNYKSDDLKVRSTVEKMHKKILLFVNETRKEYTKLLDDFLKKLHFFTNSLGIGERKEADDLYRGMLTLIAAIIPLHANITLHISNKDKMLSNDSTYNINLCSNHSSMIESILNDIERHCKVLATSNN